MNIYQHLIDCFLKDLEKGLTVLRCNENGQYSPHTIEYSSLLKFYCTGAVPKMVFLAKYKTFAPIETLTKEEKVEWKKFVNEAFPGTTPQFRLEAVKIIYTIAVLTS